jgi:hypothetical protein
VYFNSGIRSRRGYSYSPSAVISPAAFVSHLFLRQRYGHYYFGDYYASNYTGLGYSPWFSSHSSHHGYDPIYAHQRWYHRNDRQWDRRVEADFGRRREREEARPPRTWAAQRALVSNRGNAPEESFLIAGSLDQLTRNKDNPLRFQQVAKEERQRLTQQRQEIQEFRQERQRMEARTADTSAANPSQPSDPPRAKFRRSPFVARSAGQLGKDQASTKRREVLKPELQVEPPRSPRVESKPSPRVESKPLKVDRSSANRRNRNPNVNRLLEQELPLRNVPSPGGSPRPEAACRALRPHVDQPKPQPTPQPRVERSVRQPQQQRKLDQPAPAERIDRAARQSQPQSRPEPRVKRTQSQPKIDRPVSSPRVDRSAPQPRVKQPRVDRSSQRQQTQSRQEKRRGQNKDKN